MPSIRPSQVTIDAGFAGQLVPDFPPETAISQGVTASRALIFRFVATKSRTITKINFVLSVSASANDNVDVGIYNSDLTSLLGSAGSTAGKLNVTPGRQSVNLTAGVPLQQGSIYYAAWASGTQGGTAASVAMTSYAVSNIVSIVTGSATAPNVIQTFQASAFPLAAPFTPGGAIASAPILFLSE